MTAGGRNGRDYGGDLDGDSPRYPEDDSYSEWDGGAPAADRGWPPSTGGYRWQEQRPGSGHPGHPGPAGYPGWGQQPAPGGPPPPAGPPGGVPPGAMPPPRGGYPGGYGRPPPSGPVAYPPAPTYPAQPGHPGYHYPHLGQPGHPVQAGYPGPLGSGWPEQPPPEGYPDPGDGYQTSRLPPVEPYDESTDRQRRLDPVVRRRPVERRPAAESGKRKRRGLPLWQELPLLLVIALCLAILVRTFLLQAFYIPSGSMEETLIAGDRVLVNKVVYNFREPARGEVVVFQGTDAWAPLVETDEDIGSFARLGRTLGDLVGIGRPGAKDYIKRVVGLPGDIVSCCDVEGRVFVNGQPLDEDYVIRDSPLDDVPLGDCRGRRFDEVVVRPGYMFVMGDHRQVSQDSRCQGQVPLANVIGRAFVIVWPNDRWSGLSQPDTFVGVPPASGGAAAGLAPDQEPELVASPALGDRVPLPLVIGVPILMSLRVTFRGELASFRLIRRLLGRRLAA